ncbi:MAG: hypothetical protein NT094_04985 [Candidatus Staskawiczbacteria bacterium]|nr:hypothetical protein [Candidatus Staskawiczbacteria bacterium]
MTTSHKKQREFLKNKIELNQLSHAYLFSGQKDIGKKDFALELAKFLECNFPDLMIIGEANKKDEKFGDGGPARNAFGIADAGGEIKISQIREIQNFLSYKSYNGGFKIVVVNEADKMNQEAQSCFLKTLEEPKGQTLLMLISSKPDMLLPTILSRCQTIKFFKQNNSPINSEKLEKEQKLLKDLLPIISSNFAEKFKYVKAIDFPARNASHSDAGGEKQNISEIIEVLQKYLRHLLMVKIGVDKPESKDLPVQAGTNFQKYSVDDLKRILNLVEDISRKLSFTNASPKLALEILLMEL